MAESRSHHGIQGAAAFRATLSSEPRQLAVVALPEDIGERKEYVAQDRNSFDVPASSCPCAGVNEANAFKMCSEEECLQNVSTFFCTASFSDHDDDSDERDSDGELQQRIGRSLLSVRRLPEQVCAEVRFYTSSLTVPGADTSEVPRGIQVDESEDAHATSAIQPPSQQWWNELIAKRFNESDEEVSGMVTSPIPEATPLIGAPGATGGRRQLQSMPMEAIPAIQLSTSQKLDESDEGVAFAAAAQTGRGRHLESTPVELGATVRRRRLQPMPTPLQVAPTIPLLASACDASDEEASDVVQRVQSTKLRFRSRRRRSLPGMEAALAKVLLSAGAPSAPAAAAAAAAGSAAPEGTAPEADAAPPTQVTEAPATDSDAGVTASHRATLPKVGSTPAGKPSCPVRRLFRPFRTTDDTPELVIPAPPCAQRASIYYKRSRKAVLPGR